MPRRIDAGEILAAVGGVLVFVALFLSWFDGLSGWEAFESLDLVIAALALLAVAATVSSVTGAGGLSARALPWLGVLLVVVVAVQLIDPPPGALHPEVQRIDDAARFLLADPDRETGAWLALAGAALVALGGLLRLARISVTVSVGGRDVRRRVPAVDRRAAAADPPTAPTLHDDQATQPFSAIADEPPVGPGAPPAAAPPTSPEDR
ncbi:MAG TPA: hypothetical protein VF529_01735 [Solirubrobacteraceae bacterium]